MEIDGKTAATVGASAGGVLAAIMGWLMNRVYRGVHHRINDVAQTAASAAAEARAVEERRQRDTIAVHGKLDSHIQRDIEMHGEMMSVMRAQTETLGRIHASLEHALGERPTRDEVHQISKLYQGRKP